MDRARLLIVCIVNAVNGWRVYKHVRTRSQSQTSNEESEPKGSYLWMDVKLALDLTVCHSLMFIQHH